MRALNWTCGILAIGIGIVVLAAPSPTGAVIGGGGSTSAIVGAILVIGGLAGIAISEVERSIPGLEHRTLQFYDQYRKGGRAHLTMVTDPAHLFTSHTDAISIEDLKECVAAATPQELSAINATYGPSLHALRDSAPDLRHNPAAKHADELLRLIEGKEYHEHLTRSERINAIEQRYQHLFHNEPTYVHFTNSDLGERIAKGKEGLEPYGVHGTVQALLFPSRETAEKFVQTLSREGAKKITGASKSEVALVFSTPHIPQAVNTVGSGKPKALFRVALPYSQLNDLSLYRLER